MIRTIARSFTKQLSYMRYFSTVKSNEEVRDHSFGASDKPSIQAPQTPITITANQLHKSPKTIKDQLSEATDLNSLLDIASLKVIDYDDSVGILTKLCEWTLLKRINLSDYKSDQRYLKFCDHLASLYRMKDERLLNQDIYKILHDIPKSYLIKLLLQQAQGKQRNTPLLTAICEILSKNDSLFNITESSDILFSLASLNFHDKALIKKLCLNIKELLKFNSPQRFKILGSISQSLSILQFRDSSFLEALTTYFIDNMDACQLVSIRKFVMLCAVVNYKPENLDLLITKYEYSFLQDPAFHIDWVWSLVLLDSAKRRLVSATLDSAIPEKVLSEDKNKFYSGWLKLLNINAYATCILKMDGNELIKSTKIDIPFSRANHKKVVLNALHSMTPRTDYIQADIDINAGFLIDFSFSVDENLIICSPETANSRKLGVLLLDYRNMCKNEVVPNGLFNFYEKVLKSEHFHVLNLMYQDFTERSESTAAAEFIASLLKKSIN